MKDKFKGAYGEGKGNRGNSNPVKRLDHADRQVILKGIAAINKQEEPKKEERHALNLKGLGAEIWKGIDIDKYIEEERQWD